MRIECSPGDGIRFGLELIPETDDEEQVLRQLEPLLMSLRITVESEKHEGVMDTTPTS